ncbi:divalent cation transporter [Gimesia sp.]|uniref:ZIP family metal transporter n=1 Tax=Gimesia sp. TaxID=2024833 RepID=UPI000C57F86F|nr:divalent cation transporter [Gimesia sp.]MAX39191.1 divalent cation transporter [Gimesia sp.]HAH45939.1 divalent cation transporter [Planctomycetaceae bacterium]HBL42284.1 divalent cation transporter [Planctomycetaceae bacterium]
MSDVWEVIALTTLAGITIPVGGFLAKIENIHPQWLEDEFRHSVIAFGGGVLLAAVALVLIPEGISEQPPWIASLAILSGGICFMFCDIWLATHRSSAAQLLALLLDFVPESMALGASFATNSHSVGLLLAILIGLQNLPEGFNAYRELASSSTMRKSMILPGFCLLVLLGPVSGLIGFYFLASIPRLVGLIMLFAAGGILYLTFQDIAPQAQLERRWAPSLGAVIGFVFGLIAQMIID